jgi:ketosteroid isomerase-like protein
VSGQAARVALEGVAAYNRGDYGAVMEQLHPDVEVFSGPGTANEGTFHGHEGFQRWVGAWVEAWDSFRLEPAEVEPVGDHDVVVAMDTHGRGRDSGIELSFRFHYLYTVRDGLVTRVHVYATRAEALAAATA